MGVGTLTSLQVSVIIPTLNEEASLGEVLSAIPDRVVSEVLVVDGGSKDNTVGVARAGGAKVIIEPRPGYGHACESGVIRAQGDLLVFLDADGANDPGEIPELINPIMTGKADLVLGSRLAGRIYPGSMPWHQRFGNWFASWLIHQLYGLPLTDLGPFRAVSRTKLSTLNIRDKTFGWPTEMLVRAIRQGWRIIEIPVSFHPRIGGASKISGTLRGTALATFHILSTILRYAR
jgi:glycosyltransferase involved in cell wall biosynthesis